MSQSKNIIIGAGISGLSCAYALRDCLVLEKEPYIGGLCRTVEFNDFRFDLGGHRFFTNNLSVNTFFNRLLGQEIIETPRKSKIFKDGKLIDYPLRISTAFQLNPFDTTLSLSSYFYRKLRPLKERSFEERTINRFGDHLYKTFFKDYTEKVWGISCNDIAKELLDTRLQQISLIKAIKNAFVKDKNIKSFSNKIIYPKKGIVRIPEVLSSGLDIKLKKEITQIVYSNSMIKKIIVNNSDDFLCKNLVSTMPITKLVALFDPPTVIKTAAQNLKYRDLICVFIIVNKKIHTDNHWIYLHGCNIAGRLHEPKNWSADMAPENKTGICIEIFCDNNDEVWSKSDLEIAHQIIRDLPLIDKFEIGDHCVVKVENAYPIYDINYSRNLMMVRKFLSAYKNLFLIGRTGSFRYINIDSCLDEGLRMGDCLRKL
jgi:protoporphyrinogen oxidase